MWLNVPVLIVPHDTGFSWCPWESLLFSDRDRLGWLWWRGRSKGGRETWGMQEMRNFSQDVIYERKKLKIKWKCVFMCWFLNIFAKCSCLVYLIYTLITRQTIWFLAFSVTQTFASSSLSSHESDYKYQSNFLQMEGITKFCKISLGFKS